MFGLTKAIGALTALGVWIIKEIAAKWGYKVALVAAIVAVYVAAWAAIAVALSASLGLIPSMPLVAVAVQFLPSKSVVVAGAAMFLGTMATLKSWDYFRMVSGVAAKVAS